MGNTIVELMARKLEAAVNGSLSILRERGDLGSVSEANLHEICFSVSLMASGMLNWTQLI